MEDVLSASQLQTYCDAATSFREKDTAASTARDARRLFLARVPSSSAEVRGLVIHDIKEVEGVRQQEEQKDKRDEEIGDEVNGEVEEVRRDAQHTHET